MALPTSYDCALVDYVLAGRAVLCVGWIEPAQTTYLTIYMENLFVRCQAYTLCAKSFSRFLCILIFFSLLFISAHRNIGGIVRSAFVNSVQHFEVRLPI